MLVLRRLGSLVPVVVVLAVLAVPAGAAGMGVKAAIKSQDRGLRQSPALKKLERSGQVSTPAQAKKFAGDLRALARRLDRAATVVSKATASTAKQKRGQREWVAGAREVARGFSQLAVALTDLAHGHKAAAKKEARAAVKTIKRGSAIVAKGDRALGLPSTA